MTIEYIRGYKGFLAVDTDEAGQAVAFIHDSQVRLVQATLNGESMKRKPGRPKSASPRQNVRIRLPQSTVAGIDTLVGAVYPDRTAVIEQAITAYLKAQGV